MKIGFIGLGKMGSRIAKKLAVGGHTVWVWNRSPEPARTLASEVPSLRVARSVEDLVQQLPAPRIVWLMLPAGEATETLLQQLIPLLAKDDIVIDGGNAYFKDTQRRASQLAAKGLRFLGIGVSGGIVAEKQGYPAMVGGDQRAYETIKPILDTLAVPHGGHAYFGPGGAGHFVKMVHNGIEYGIMQALAEGFAVLEKSPYNVDLSAVAGLWQKGTLVSGFMLDRAAEVLAQDQKLTNVVGVVAESGEARWTVEEAQKEGVPVEIIAASLDYRKRSQTDTRIQQSFTAKMVAALRAAFGGHQVQKTQ